MRRFDLVDLQVARFMDKLDLALAAQSLIMMELNLQLPPEEALIQPNPEAFDIFEADEQQHAATQTCNVYLEPNACKAIMDKIIADNTEWESMRAAEKLIGDFALENERGNTMDDIENNPDTLDNIENNPDAMDNIENNPDNIVLESNTGTTAADDLLGNCASENLLANATLKHNIAKIVSGNPLRCNARFQSADMEEFWFVPNQGCWFDHLDDEGDAIIGVGPCAKVTISKQDFDKVDLT